MEVPEGMVAVVRGLPDAALAVSLLEGGRQYTLLPNNAVPNMEPMAPYVQITPKPMVYGPTEITNETRLQQGAGCHSSTQAIDGRYTSVYKMAHCKLKPTSPPVLLTEFPPQRAELCRGQGNFEVGGLGSGEVNCSYTRTNGNYRGAMNWPERGAVCAPKATTEPDAFAQSLRRYPNMSPERSSEIIERLINYTQTKNLSPAKSRSPSPPNRSVCNSAQGYDRRSLATSLRSQKVYETESNIKPKIPEESPTKEIAKKNDFETGDFRKTPFSRAYDVRYFRECRRIKENFKSNNNFVKDSAHKETQAEIPMISREVATIPRPQPSTRNVAVSLSMSSTYFEVPRRELQARWSSKSIQTSKACLQACISSIDVNQRNEKRIKNCRKSKSQEELRVNDELEQELIQLIKELSTGSDDTEYNIRNELLRKLKKIQTTNRSDKLKLKFGRCIRDQLYSQIDFKIFTRELSNELISKIKANNMILSSLNPTNNTIDDIDSNKDCNEDNRINELIKEWLDDIPIKALDYLGRRVKKDYVIQTVAGKIKSLIMNKVNHNCYNSLKPELFDILEDIPIEVNASNKLYYLNRIVDNLVKKIEDFCSINAKGRKRWKRAININKSSKKPMRQDLFACKHIQLTDNELKQFAEKELKKFADDFHLKICPTTEKQIQLELVDILVDSIEEIRYGNDERVKKEILLMLSELIVVSENESIFFVNNITNNLKNMLNESLLDISNTQQTFMVLQDPAQTTSMQTQNQTHDYSIEGISNQDIINNLNLYTKLIVQQIIEWIEDVQEYSQMDSSYKKVISNELAEDIVNRHKYLELNPNSRGTDAEESEHLKYKIFKWINNLVSENSLEAVTHASQLTKKIQSIPVPMLTKPTHNVNTSLPSNSKRRLQSDSKVDSMRDDILRDSTLKDSIIIRDGTMRDSTIKDCTARESTKRDNSDIRYNTTKDDVARKKTRDDSQINKTKFSFPSKHASENLSSFKEHSGRDFRTLESLGKVSDESELKPQVGHVSRKSFRVTTDLSESQLQKKAAYTETEMPEIPKTHPYNTSESVIKPLIEESNNKYNRSTELSSKLTNTQYSQNTIPTKVNLQSSNNKPTATHSIKQLNDEYDVYLQNWVEQIPIITSDPEEQALIDKMRLGIYNGIWKALTKLHMNPTTLDNPFYYQDILDDEIEELLDLLPQSKELTNQKQMLKTQLIEKTIQMNQQIFNTTASSSYKQQLVDNVANNLPRKTLGFTESDIPKICEEVHKLNLAEYYIMYTMYRETDQVKASAYKKKLMKSIQEFFDTLRRTHGVRAPDFDLKNYEDEIVSALAKVPLPTDETIMEEGEEILIGLEIEQWFSDLPLYPTDSTFETLSRKRYRDTLAKKVHDLERQSNLNDCEEELRHEITRFMGKLPMRSEDLENMPFMVEELVNRLKNRPKDVVSGSRKVNFLDYTHNYDEFSRDMQLCSSFSNEPDAKRAQVNESSYMIVGGERVDTHEYQGQNVQTYRKTYHRDIFPPESQQKWYTLLPDSVQSAAKQTSQVKSMQNSQRAEYPAINPLQASGVQMGVPQTTGVQMGLSQAPGGQTSLQQTSGVHMGRPQGPETPISLSKSSEIQMGVSQAPGLQMGFPQSSGVQMGISQASGVEMSPIQTSNSQIGQGPQVSGHMMRNVQEPIQNCACSQTSVSSLKVRNETFGGQPALDHSYRQSTADNMQRQTCMRPDQYNASRMSQGHSACPGRANVQYGQRNVSGQRSPATPGFFPANGSFGAGPTNQGSQVSSASYIPPSPAFAPTTGVGPVSNRPYQEGSSTFGPQEPGPFNDGSYPYSSSNFYRPPMGFSTPQQNIPSPRESRPKKRIRDVDRAGRDSVRRKLHLTDSDESLKEEVRCRCMERVWRCRKKRSVCLPCDECEMEFPSCFRYPPYSYYF